MVTGPWWCHNWRPWISPYLLGLSSILVFPSDCFCRSTFHDSVSAYLMRRALLSASCLCPNTVSWCHHTHACITRLPQSNTNSNLSAKIKRSLLKECKSLSKLKPQHPADGFPLWVSQKDSSHLPHTLLNWVNLLSICRKSFSAAEWNWNRLTPHTSAFWSWLKLQKVVSEQWKTSTSKNNLSIISPATASLDLNFRVRANIYALSQRFCTPMLVCALE